MAALKIGTVTERLAKNSYEVDEGNSHIEVNQEAAKRTGFGKVLERVCPAHVYTANEDGSVDVEYAACLECGTCLAVAPREVLHWGYPEGAMGISFREG